MPLQTKLAVGQPNDTYEREAEMAANASESSSPIRPTRLNISIPQSTNAPPIVHETLRSSGQPIGSDTLRLYEPKFGHDFSKVRIHSDRQAAKSSAAIGAVAYTSGNHIAFAEGKYAPGTDSGRRLLGHELTHVVQQSRGQAMVQREPVKEDEEAKEQEKEKPKEPDPSSAPALQGQPPPNRCRAILFPVCPKIRRSSPRRIAKN